MHWTRAATTIVLILAGLILAQGGCVLVPRSADGGAADVTPIRDAADAMATASADQAVAVVADDGMTEPTAQSDTSTPAVPTPAPRPAPASALSPGPRGSPTGVSKPTPVAAVASAITQTTTELLA